MSTLKVSLEAHIPEDERGAFLQLIRAWEGGRPEIQMAIRIDSDAPIESARAMLERLTPELPDLQILRRDWDEERKKYETQAAILAMSRLEAHAVIARFLWRSVADQAGCTCDLSSVCPECAAMHALGCAAGWTTPAMAAAFLEQHRRGRTT